MPRWPTAKGKSSRSASRPSWTRTFPGDSHTIVVVGLPPGPHRLLLELADPAHHVLTGQTVAFNVPAAARAGRLGARFVVDNSRILEILNFTTSIGVPDREAPAPARERARPRPVDPILRNPVRRRA